MASKGRELGNIVSPTTGIAVTISGDPVVLGVGNTEHFRITGDGTFYLGGYLQSSTVHNTVQKIAVAPYNWTGGSTAEIASIEMGAASTGNDDGNIIFKTATNVNTGGTLNEAMRIRYDGNVGIGTDAPSTVFHVQAGWPKQTIKSTNTNTAGSLVFDNTNITTADYLLGQIAGKWQGTDVAYINFEAGADTTNKDDGVITFSTSSAGGSPTERLRILSSGGITFNGDTAAANALDDYEEGTWSPDFIDYNDGNPMYANHGPTVYHATYVKIGEYCWISAYLANDASFSYASGKNGTQNLGIGGLPFTVVGSSAGFYPISVGYFQSWNGWDASGYGYMPSGYFYSGYTRIVFTYPNTNGVSNVPGSSMNAANAGILFSGYYKVA